MNYQTILTIKESEKATVLLAAVEVCVGPVIVKKLKGGKPEIYRLLAEQSNTHIPQIYAVEEQEDEILVAEEYVDGESLGEHLQKHLLSDDQKLELALQLCEAVGFLHAMKPSVIHRDIKPSNILVNNKLELKLIDFDASRQYKDTPSSSDTRLMGTVEYAPPEQFGYSQTDVRSDIYSMGVVFHEMRPTENKKLAEKWEKISEKCTSFDPKNRYQSVEELKREIEKLAAWKKTRKNRSIAGIGATAVVLAVAATAVFLWPKQKQAEQTGGTVPTSGVTVTSALTPEAVLTLTPEPTATNTPVPTETPTPSPEPDSIGNLDEVIESLRAQKFFIDNFYKGLESAGDYRMYSTMYEGKEIVFTSVTMYNLLTDTLLSVPAEEFYNENNVLHIRSSYLQGLDATCYRMMIRYEDKATGRTGDMQTHLLIFEGKDVNPEAQVLNNNYLDFYYEYDACIHTIVANNVEGCFADTGVGRILENGRVLELDYEYLMQYMEPGREGEVVFNVKLEDGRMGTLVVNYKTGIPSYAK